MSDKQISLYIHVPFCRRKCSYCHFYVIGNSAEGQTKFIEALLCEWQQLLPLCADKKVTSIYFGGGTPALLGAEKLNFLLAEITAHLNLDEQCEITVEANPEEISSELVKGLVSGGFNRLSIGIQTHDNGILTLLGRTHNDVTAFNAIEIAASAGICNISADLMYDLPDQTQPIWEESLRRVVQLPLQHLSLYNLTIEPNTAFYRQKEKLSKRMPDAEGSAEMLTYACNYLASCGFLHYEISAFARNGMYSRHNVGYWTNRSFLGLGPSAFSYWEGRRYRNVANLQSYSEAVQKGLTPIDFSETLLPEEHLSERLAVNLRLFKGIALQEFPTLSTRLKKITDQLIEQELLEIEGGRLRLTKKGIFFYDTVATELIYTSD